MPATRDTTSVVTGTRESAPGTLPIWVPAAWLATFLIIYLPDLGRGFILDDFAWIRAGHIGGPSDLLRIVTGNLGFYRPLVALSFGVNDAISGLHPFAYGVTNLLLFAIDGLLLFTLARRLGLRRDAAAIAVAIWAFNFHGVNMALLWLSGRTALLAGAFALLAANAFVRGARFTAGLATLAAMCSKEEAILLPAILTASHLLAGGAPATRGRVASAASSSWPVWLALAAYAALRIHSGAYVPSSAPSYYQFSTDVVLVLRNAAEYADRAATFAAGVTLLFWLGAGAPRIRLDRDQRRVVIVAAVWACGMSALTVLLPLRSSLYALLPSAGVALSAAASIAACARVAPSRVSRTAVALAVILVALIPVYRARNHRWTALADLSRRTMATVTETAAPLPGGVIVLVDDPRARFNLESAIGTLLPDALAVALGPAWTGQIVPPVAGLPANANLVFHFTDGSLTLAATHAP